jgi:histidinol-phosphate aminotransferase
MKGMPAPREEIVALRSYVAGDQHHDAIRLNANEAPLSGDEPALNRYPQIRPVTLRDRLSTLFDVPPENLVVTRGSSEAIDVLIRAWCRAYRDSLVTTPPNFEMYRVYADIQGIRTINVPLDLENDFRLDAEAVIAACDETTRLVLLCSPNNPTGTLIPREDILRIVSQQAGRSIVVVDEAYVEFSDRESLAGETAAHGNLVVLRTLSKAHALAGARCGAAIANAEIIDIMNKVLPPYSFATPVVDAVLETLTSERIETAQAAIAAIVAERTRLYDALQNLSCIHQTWPSQSNFLFARFANLAAALDFLQERGILIRDFSKAAGLENCARITIGTRDENDALISALTEFGGAPGG